MARLSGNDERRAAQLICSNGTGAVEGFLRAVADCFSNPAVAIWRAEGKPGERTFNRVASLGAFDKVDRDIPEGAGVVGQVVGLRPVWWRKGVRLRTHDGDIVEPYHQDFLKNQRFESVLAMPIRDERSERESPRAIGAITLYWHAGHEVRPSDFLIDLVACVAFRFLTDDQIDFQYDMARRQLSDQLNSLSAATAAATYIHDFIRAVGNFDEAVGDLLRGLPSSTTLSAAMSVSRSILAEYERVQTISAASHEILNPKPAPGRGFSLSEVLSHFHAIAELRYKNAHDDLGVRPIVRGASAAGSLRGQPAALVRALVNLYDNSVYWCNEKGEFRVAIHDAGSNAVMIEIDDSGPGLVPTLSVEDLGKLGKTGRDGGLGIGLAMVKQSCLDNSWDCRFRARTSKGGFVTEIRIPKVT